MNELSADFLEDVIEMAVADVLNLVGFLSDELLSGGRVFGDVVNNSDGEKVARYVDLAQSGALTMLPSVNPKLRGQLDREFDGAMGRQIEGAV